MQLRQSIQEFALDMNRKMEENDWKGGWDNCDLEHLLMRLTQEKSELSKAIRKHEDNYYSPQPVDIELIQRVIDEAADVGNFAMMIADNARTRKLLYVHT